MITASDGVPHTTMPSIMEDPVDSLPLEDCRYFYEHFRENHIEWAYFNIDSSIPAASDPRLFDTDGASLTHVTHFTVLLIVPHFGLRLCLRNIPHLQCLIGSRAVLAVPIDWL